MRRLLLLAVLIPLLGCGGRRGPTEEQRVRDVLATFARATEQRDYAKLCSDVLAPKLLSGLQQIGLPCETALQRSLGSVRNPRLTVGAVAVKGDSASAEVRTSADGQEPSSDTVRLVKVEGAWRISALGTPGA